MSPTETTVSPVREDPGPVLLPAILLAAAAAVAGGLGWGLLVKNSEYELGLAAWGIGLLAGGAVLVGARGARGPALQGVAVAGALAGIALGKYLSFAWMAQEVLREEDGIEVGLFSSEMIELVRLNLGLVFGLFDVLWVGLAVFTAWRMLRRAAPAFESPAS